MRSDWGQRGEGVEAEQGAVEEAELWRAYKLTRDGEALDSLIAEYQGLVRYVAGLMAKTLPSGVSFDDLVSYGLLGLAEAIERFEPERGYRFSTFAAPRIRGAILDCLRADDWVPRSIRRRSRAVADAEARLTNTLGRTPTGDELAAELGISVTELDQRRVEMNAATLERLDDRSGDHERDRFAGTRREAVRFDEQDPELLDDVVARTRILVAAIGDLPDRTKLILALYYYENMPLSQIGQVLGVSESRVSRILSAGIASMRRSVYEGDLDAMLG